MTTLMGTCLSWGARCLKLLHVKCSKCFTSVEHTVFMCTEIMHQTKLLGTKWEQMSFLSVPLQIQDNCSHFSLTLCAFNLIRKSSDTEQSLTHVKPISEAHKKQLKEPRTERISSSRTSMSCRFPIDVRASGWVTAAGTEGEVCPTTPSHDLMFTPTQWQNNLCTTHLRFKLKWLRSPVF